MSRRPSIIGSLTASTPNSALEAMPTAVARPKPKPTDIVHTSIYVPKASSLKKDSIVEVDGKKALLESSFTGA